MLILVFSVLFLVASHTRGLTILTSFKDVFKLCLFWVTCRGLGSSELLFLQSLVSHHPRWVGVRLLVFRFHTLSLLSGFIAEVTPGRPQI